MTERLLVVLFQVVTLFLLMGVGFTLGKLGKMTGAGTKEIADFLLLFVTPCVIINAFQIDWDVAFLKTMSMGLGSMLGIYILLMILIGFLFRKEEPDLRDPLRFGVVYGNVGYMGIPLVSAVLGEDKVIFAVLGVMAFNIVAFSHGALLMGGRKAVSVKNALVNPGTLSSLVGLILMLTRIGLPGPVHQAVGFLAGVNTPVAMVVIGAQLSRADLRAVFRQMKLYKVVVFRQIFAPILAALVLLPLGLNRDLYIATVILFGTPVAGLTSIFAERYHRNVAYTAQLVSLSTLLSILTLPPVAILAELLAK